VKLISELDVVQEATAKGGFLRDFVNHASPLTDAPKVLHLWVALGTLAGPSDPYSTTKNPYLF
jgi:hypothetical protein